MQIIKGIDVSYYDWILNWELYNADFAFIKCSEGVVIDKVFKEQWRQAKGRTIRAAYHFFRPMVDPVKAAGAFADYLDGDVGELPPIVDLETADGRNDAVSRSILFVNELHRIIHVPAMYYSSPSFLENNYASRYGQLAEYKLWLATYPFDKVQGTWTEERRKKQLQDIWEGRFLLAAPPPPKPFKRVSFFQFTGKGDPSLIGGYTSSKEAVDMNLYNGNSVDEMKKEFQILYVPQPEGEMMTTIYGKVMSFTNIRNGPYDSYQDIGDLQAGSTIEADAKTNDAIGRPWYHLTKASNSNGGPIITTLGKLVSEVTAWCYGGNIEEYTPESTGTKTINTIEVNGVENIVIHYSDGSTETKP